MPGVSLLAPNNAFPQLVVSEDMPATADPGAWPVYTVPAQQSVRISSGIIANHTNNDLNVWISINKGGSDLPGYVLYSYQLAAEDSLPLREFLQDLWISDGDVINAHCDAPGSVSLLISGTVYS